MKTMKKVIGLILVAAMVFAMSIPTFATSLDSNRCTKTDTILLDDGFAMCTQDFENGDAKFTLEKDGKVIAWSYLERESGKVYNYDSRSELSYNVVDTGVRYDSTEPFLSTSYPPPAESVIPDGFTKKGVITYNFYGMTTSVIGTRDINVYYDRNVDTSASYNLNGQYQNIISLASMIASVLSLPGMVAGKIAQWVVGLIGVALSGAPFAIPDLYVKCTRTDMTWLSQWADFPDIYGTFTGSMYKVTQDGYESQVIYEGEYWPLSAYSSHDSDFAVKCYYTAVGQDYLEIVNWS